MYSKTEYLKKAIGDNNFLLYNNEERFLYIKNNMISNKEFRSLSSTLEFLQYNRSPEGLFKRIKISDINFAHRDASLTYYCHQFLDQGISHQETHWIKYAQKSDLEKMWNL